MKIGFAPSGRRSAADAVLLARLAEDAGASDVWVSEDYLERGAFAVAGAMAAVTETVRIGLGVINPWTRHVALTAMESVALDEIAAGRAVIGLGASNERWMSGRLGVDFDRPISRLAEYTAALRTLMDGGLVDTEVGGLTLDAQLDFVPDRTGIPIYWGVKGPRALRLGTEHADGLMLSVLSSPGYVRWIAETYAPANITAYASFAVDTDGAAAKDRLRSHTGRFLGIHGASPITEKAGLPAERAAEFTARLVAGADAADLVDDDILREVTVSGTPEECAASLLRFRDAGVDTLVVIDDGSSSPADLVAGVMHAARLAHLA